jgi:lysozyme
MPFPVVTSQQIRGLSKGAVGAVAIATASIIAWEGYEPVARHDPIDPPGIITVCNGITNYDMPDLKVGTRFNEQCAGLLTKHLPRYTVKVDKCVTADISENTRAALYSAAYNLGARCRLPIQR